MYQTVASERHAFMVQLLEDTSAGGSRQACATSAAEECWPQHCLNAAARLMSACMESLHNPEHATRRNLLGMPAGA